MLGQGSWNLGQISENSLLILCYDYYIEIRKHSKKAFEELSVDGLSIALSFNEPQQPIHCSSLHNLV